MKKIIDLFFNKSKATLPNIEVAPTTVDNELIILKKYLENNTNVGISRIGSSIYYNNFISNKMESFSPDIPIRDVEVQTLHKLVMNITLNDIYPFIDEYASQYPIQNYNGMISFCYDEKYSYLLINGNIFLKKEFTVKIDMSKNIFNLYVSEAMNDLINQLSLKKLLPIFCFENKIKQSDVLDDLIVFSRHYLANYSKSKEWLISHSMDLNPLGSYNLILKDLENNAIL